METFAGVDYAHIDSVLTDEERLVRQTARRLLDEAAVDPRIDGLRQKMHVVENPRFSRDYLDPEMRSIASAVQVYFRDGSATGRIEIEYPLGHRRRRREAIPMLRLKFERALAGRFPPPRVEQILHVLAAPARLDSTPVHEFVELWVQ